MNQTTRRNWLKTTAALAAGVVTLPLVAPAVINVWDELDKVMHRFPKGTGLKTVCYGKQVTCRRVRNTEGIPLVPRRVMLWSSTRYPRHLRYRMVRLNLLDRSKTWRG